MDGRISEKLLCLQYIEERLVKPTGCPKKMVILSGFEFLTLAGVFLGVKINSKNSGTKKNTRLFSKRGMQKSGFLYPRAHNSVT